MGPQAMAASVVCMQAVGGELYEELLKPEMAKLGYEATMMRLSGKKDDPHRVGVATFFHSGTFRLLKVGFLICRHRALIPCHLQHTNS